MYDVIIKNGTVIDGTGQKEGYRADIGIKNGKILTVGGLKSAEAKQVIEADDLIVAPGFIDIQNHSDSYGALFRNPSLESMLYQGITTVLVGQCGSSLAPLLKGSLASIQKWTKIAGLNVNWLSLSEFFKEIEKKQLGVNLATLIGHTTLRRDFVGDNPRSLTPKESKQIEILYKRSLIEGAWGLSIGLAYSHDRSSDEEELIKLLSLTAKNKRVASFHLRDEGKGIISSLNEVLFLTKNSGVKAKIAHFKVKEKQGPAIAEQLLETLEKGKRDGIDIYFDAYPYSVSTIVLYLLLPLWATEGGRADLIEKIKNPHLRTEIIKSMRQEENSYENLTIASSTIDRTLIGKNIGQIAKNQNTSTEDIILNLILATDDQIIVFADNLHEPIVERFLAHPQSMIATDGSGWSSSDAAWRGLDHPRSFGTTARVFSHYVRDKKVLSIEKAVYKMSGMPAEFLGFKNMGIIKEGYRADIVVFSQEDIKDRATYENPYRYPQGIPYVLVNGEIVIDKGSYNGKMAGGLLVRPQ